MPVKRPNKSKNNLNGIWLDKKEKSRRKKLRNFLIGFVRGTSKRKRRSSCKKMRKIFLLLEPSLLKRRRKKKSKGQKLNNNNSSQRKKDFRLSIERLKISLANLLLILKRSQKKRK